VIGAHADKCGAHTVAVGGTTPLSNSRKREKPGNGPFGWPSLLYIQLSGGAAAAAGAGAAAGGEAAAPAVAIFPMLERCRWQSSDQCNIKALQ